MTSRSGGARRRGRGGIGVLHGVAGKLAALGRRPDGDPRDPGGAGSHPHSQRALGAAPARQSCHRGTQHQAQASHSALQADQASGADRSSGVRPGSAAGGGGIFDRNRRAERSRDGKGAALRPRDRSGVQRLCLFSRRDADRAGRFPYAVPGADRRPQRRGAGRRRSGLVGDLRHQSSLEHGLRAGDLCRRDLVGAELRRRRMGARSGASAI